MEFNVKLSELLGERRYKYLLINCIAKRARALNEGARPEIPMQGGNPLDLTTVSIQEIDQDKIRVEPSERAGQLVDIAGIVK